MLNGPEPAATVDALRELEADGALIVQGNTDIAVADFDYAAAFPWMTDGVPDTIRAAAEWAHDAARRRAARLAAPAAGRAPAARRRHAGPGLPRLAGLADRRASTRRSTPTVTLERVARTDARVIGCGHTHLPEVRDLGWKLIVNAGSAGYVFDGDPTRVVGADRRSTSERASTAEIRRDRRYDDARAVANAISARGLPGDVYRAATVRTGKLVR